jgi:hypothetical protein
MKGFSVKWGHWISQFVTKDSVGVMMNEKLGRYFQTKKFKVKRPFVTFTV